MTFPLCTAASLAGDAVGGHADHVQCLDKAERYGLKVARAAARLVQDLDNAMHAQPSILLQGLLPSSPTSHGRIVCSRPYGTA